MARSSLIVSDNANKHRSRLITSLQTIKSANYETKPDGVWGSTATIKCGDVTIRSSELDFEFDISFDDNLESDEGEITVYNLSNNTINQLKVDSSISIEAGYEGDTGIVFKGFITKVSTKRDNADKVTTIKIIDAIQDLSIDEGYTGTPSVILKNLINEFCRKKRLSTGLIKAERNTTGNDDNGVTAGDSLATAIKTYSNACGVSTFIRNGTVYSCKINKISNDTTFNISEETGMIGSPSPFEEKSKVENYENPEEDFEDTIKGYDIEMLLQHRASVGAIVNLTSEQYSGKYYIKSGNHRFNESECITTIRVVQM